jgi:phospholipid N-methyltransferase
MTGEVAALQDVPLAYDPAEWGRLMQPILEDRADAVTGSRLSAPQGLVRGYRGTWLCRGATLATNLLNDLSLTDALSGCKLVRADVLRHLRLRGTGFALEAELIGRLAQWGARLYEMPIAAPAACESDRRGRRVSEVVAALGTMIRCRFFSPRYTDWQRPFSLCVGSGAIRQQRWLLDKVRPYLGSRVLQTGAGVGHVGSRLLDRELLVLLEREPMYASALRHRFSGRQNVLVEETELLSRAQARRWQAERLDTVFCCDYLESAPQDEAALRQFHDMLSPGGRCILVVPAGRWLYSAMDRGLGYVRRYGRKELQAMVEQAGFELVAVRSFGKLAALARAFSGHLLRRRRLSPTLARWHDRLWALIRWFDFLLPTPAAGLLVVGRKPKDRSQRMAA